MSQWAHVMLFKVAANIPAGIIGSAEAQVNGNLNEWVRTDMNEC